MNPPVQTLFGAPDPNAAPLNIVELVSLLNQLVNSQILGSYLPYVIGIDTPSVDDRGKVWIQLDAVGRPIATKIWVATAGGAWRRVYNGMPGQICMYSGDPTVDFPTGSRGVVGGTYDGWALCDGNNGTIDLSSKFIIAGQMNNHAVNGWNGQNWGAYLYGQRFNTGGVDSIKLDADHTWRQKIEVSMWTASGNAPASNGDLYGLPAPNQVPVIQLQSDNQNPAPIGSVPPFVALGFIQFVGY